MAYQVQVVVAIGGGVVVVENERVKVEPVGIFKLRHTASVVAEVEDVVVAFVVFKQVDVHSWLN